MDKFTSLTAVAAVMDRPNIDTDLMVPKQFLTRIERAGFGAVLFNNIRYHENGSPNEDFILNQSRYQGAQILVALENFGCGSSREHAPWALLDYGFKVLISPKFADIFKNNCAKNGMVLIELGKPVVVDLITRIMSNPGYKLHVDLQNQTIAGDDDFEANFDYDPFRKEMLLNGWDDISLTLKIDDDIRAYESRHSASWNGGLLVAQR